MVEMSLAEYREQLAIQRETGAELERERIIKLLDEVIYSWDNELRVSSDFDTFQDLIALIKGEK